jgi:hypothetical protein
MTFEQATRWGGRPGARAGGRRRGAPGRHWRALRHITTGPRKIGDIVKAALVLTHFEHGRLVRKSFEITSLTPSITRCVVCYDTTYTYYQGVVRATRRFTAEEPGLGADVARPCSPAPTPEDSTAPISPTLQNMLPCFQDILRLGWRGVQR